MDETLNEDSIKKVAAGNLEEDPFADSNIILENNDGLEEADDNCGYCGEKFDNENELNLHIIEVHGWLNIFEISNICLKLPGLFYLVLMALASTRENHETVFEERLWKRKQQQRLQIMMLHFIDNNDGL